MKRKNDNLNSTEIKCEDNQKEDSIKRNKSISQTRIKQLLDNDTSKRSNSKFLQKIQDISKEFPGSKIFNRINLTTEKKKTLLEEYKRLFKKKYLKQEQ